MKFEFLVEFNAVLRRPGTQIGTGPSGTRMVVDVTGGSFEGPRLKGELLSSGGDWWVRDAKDVTRLDVRVTLVTDDGANIYLQYVGIREAADPSAPQTGERQSTEYGEQYFMTAPRFETGDERYAWLNELICVGEGRVTDDGVAYRVYAVVND